MNISKGNKEREQRQQEEPGMILEPEPYYSLLQRQRMGQLLSSQDLHLHLTLGNLPWSYQLSILENKVSQSFLEQLKRQQW